MAAGFRSPLFLLGISRGEVEVKVGRGAGPLPISIGVPEAVVKVGRGAGPLPIHMGAIGVYSPPVEKFQTGGGGGSKSRETDIWLAHALREDEELIHLLTVIIPLLN